MSEPDGTMGTMAEHFGVTRDRMDLVLRVGYAASELLMSRGDYFKFETKEYYMAMAVVSGALNEAVPGLRDVIEERKKGRT